MEDWQIGLICLAIYLSIGVLVISVYYYTKRGQINWKGAKFFTVWIIFTWPMALHLLFPNVYGDE